MEMKLTPTQQRIYDILQDGGEHTSAELVKCLDDEYTQASMVVNHVSALRRNLARYGLTIASVQIPGHPPSYKIVRRLPSAYDGRK